MACRKVYDARRKRDFLPPDSGSIWCVTMGGMSQAPHRSITRRGDEPKLEIGEKIEIEEGVVGLVLARYTRSGDPRNDVHYVVEPRPEAEEH